ncbi:ABC transporter ATP-binding protein [Peloplasma aerotolerans]|uniref:ABC transporter ATP-binding protein n=1 Tax=Peloplasma aerotolerans TaxID=3044389 RepID=A0AAW6UC65_9MOLU|nr:ABC transporter ATP-binding protein [Mariniplasma sp. M4Ah]MDI6452548.1 ABC transporter ATP-binding protein [Mariniplasma sp. M4Ah]
MSKISLQHVYKSFQKDTYVIDDISLEIFDDEFLVLVGPSGSGKTTTLRMIAGLEEMTKGNLYIDNRIQNDEDPSTRKLSFVFQNYALLPNLTVYENIEFGLLNKQMNQLEKKKTVEETAIKLSLYEKLNSYPNQLSGGQRQRVALARALVDQSSLVLFDEPLSNLDAVLREEMRTELITLQKMFRMTCIYVTHDQIEAMAMASRIVLMMEGKIVQVGTPYQMYHDPMHLDVVTFMGTPEANVLTVEYKDGLLYTQGSKMIYNQEIAKLMKKHKIDKGHIAIRPKDLVVYHQQSDYRISGTLVAVEHYGLNKLLHIEALGQTFRAVVDRDFEEKIQVYLDFKGHALLFNQDKKRVLDTVQTKIIIDDQPKDYEHLQIVNELQNYGYEIDYDEKNADLKIDEKNKIYTYTQNKKEIQLKDLKDVFTYVHYIKACLADKEI